MKTLTRKIILLDADEQLSRQVARVFGSRFVVTGIRDAKRAASVIAADSHIDVVIVGTLMSGAKAVEFLDLVREKRPNIRRALVSEYSDLSSIVAGLHGGAIGSLIQNPTTDAQMLIAIYPEVAGRAAQLRLSA